MFAELLPILADRTLRIDVRLDADGETVHLHVIPAGKTGENALLSEALCLSGTAADLDAEFAQSLGHYTEAHLSVKEQTEETARKIKAAAQAEADAAKEKAKAKTDKIKAKPASGAAAGTANPTDSAEDNTEKPAGPAKDAAKPAKPAEPAMPSLFDPAPQS